MENLAPPLSVALKLQLEMENGQSFRESLRKLLALSAKLGDHDDFTCVLREWSVRKSHNQSTVSLMKSQKSPYRRALIDLFDRAWTGEPILEPLQALEKEIRQAAQAELDHFVANLPFRAMIPLLLLQFPAYMLLLLGPVLTDLSHQLGSS